LPLLLRRRLAFAPACARNRSYPHFCGDDPWAPGRYACAMRGSRRHPTWDYGEPGGYFVTICADRRWFRSVPVPERGVAGLFASVCGPQPDLTELGLV